MKKKWNDQRLDERKRTNRGDESGLIWMVVALDGSSKRRVKLVRDRISTRSPDSTGWDRSRTSTTISTALRLCTLHAYCVLFCSLLLMSAMFVSAVLRIVTDWVLEVKISNKLNFVSAHQILIQP